MRIVYILLALAVLVACIGCYYAGYRSGAKLSPLREDREGQILYALGAYHALETTNLVKLHSFIDIQLLGNTRLYERQFGLPSGTNIVGRRLAEAKVIADQVEKQLVPLASYLQSAISSNVTIKIGE